MDPHCTTAVPWSISPQVKLLPVTLGGIPKGPHIGIHSPLVIQAFSQIQTWILVCDVSILQRGVVHFTGVKRNAFRVQGSGRIRQDRGPGPP